MPAGDILIFIEHLKAIFLFKRLQFFFQVDGIDFSFSRNLKSLNKLWVLNNNFLLSNNLVRKLLFYSRQNSWFCPRILYFYFVCMHACLHVLCMCIRCVLCVFRDRTENQIHWNWSYKWL